MHSHHVLMSHACDCGPRVVGKSQSISGKVLLKIECLVFDLIAPSQPQRGLCCSGTRGPPSSVLRCVSPGSLHTGGRSGSLAGMGRVGTAHCPSFWMANLSCVVLTSCVRQRQRGLVSCPATPLQADGLSSGRLCGAGARDRVARFPGTSVGEAPLMVSVLHPPGGICPPAVKGPSAVFRRT